MCPGSSRALCRRRLWCLPGGFELAFDGVEVHVAVEIQRLFPVFAGGGLVAERVEDVAGVVRDGGVGVVAADSDGAQGLPFRLLVTLQLEEDPRVAVGDRAVLRVEFDGLLKVAERLGELVIVVGEDVA